MTTPKARLTDPADEGAEVETGTLSMDSITFQPVPVEAAKTARPFDGYPLAKKIDIGGAAVSPTFIVALNPTVAVQQDPNNRKVRTKDGGYRQVQTFHSRFIRDREAGDNIEVVFDREIRKDGVSYFCAVIPSHIVRSQIVFAYNNKSNRVEVDSRYLLMDLDQTARLKRVFEQVINPNLKMERAAAFISGQADSDPGEVAPLTENEV